MTGSEADRSARAGQRLFRCLAVVALLLPIPLVSSPEPGHWLLMLLFGGWQAAPFLVMARERLGPRHLLAGLLGIGILLLFWSVVMAEQLAPLWGGPRPNSTSGIGVACYGMVLPIVVALLMLTIGTAKAPPVGREK